MKPAPGPLVARVYLRLLAAVSLVAWLSLAVQIRLLIGQDGLLPITPLLAAAKHEGYGFFDLPTLFWLRSTDGVLLAAVALGAAASLFGVLRVGRAWLLVSLPLYLSVAIAAQDFCAFQWDYLLIEASALALFVDPRGPTRAAVWLQRLLLVKLYVESGLSKALSPLGDWLSGSAMSAYFETAPLPTPIARWLHAAPTAVLHGSSYLVLVVEILVPLFVFGPRALRRLAFVLLTVFQLINFASANYGFFVPLTLALHVWLLDDETMARWLRVRTEPIVPRFGSLAGVFAGACLCLWAALSLVEGRIALGPELTADSPLQSLAWLRERYVPFRIIGVYHLFASVTTERVEPILEVQNERGQLVELALHYKPGPIDRGLPFVAPHQPRVDFLLWFHGLQPKARLPLYLYRLETMLCEAPSRVASLFATPLPAHIEGVRLRYARYHFTKLGSTAPWTREDLFARPMHSCLGVDEEHATR